MKILDKFKNSLKRPQTDDFSAAEETPEPRRNTMEDLWFSLCDDPNQEEVLPELLDACQAKGGPVAVRAALEELILEQGSWLPQLYFARILLEEKNIGQARDLYQSILARPESLDYELFTVSADLGKFGYAEEIPSLVADLYDVSSHNIYIGLNLLQAYRDTMQPDAGMALLTNVRRYDNPEIHAYLDDFAKAFAEMKKKSLSGETDGIAGAGDAAEKFAKEQPAAESVPSVKLPRALWVDVPLWRHEYPSVDDLLPKTDGKKRVGVYMYADTAADEPEQTPPEDDAVPPDLSVSLPVCIGERLLFTTHLAPIVLFPVNRQKGPYAAMFEPDISSLFGLCAQESLDYIVTGTIALDGDVYRTRTWILDKSKQSARIVAKDLPLAKFGDAFNELIEEVMILFYDKRYTRPLGRTELFTYTHPLPELVLPQLQGTRALLYQYLVRQNECDASILPDEKFVLDMFAYLCDVDNTNQMYFMALFSAMKNGKHSGSKLYLANRAALFRFADKNRYAPCVKVLMPELNELLADA